VSPLTQALHESPGARPVDSVTPFLVVFDEAWFRDYGVGEQLGAYVAHVKPEIPEVVPTQAERRFVPLPDHYLNVSNILHNKPPDFFGPSGMTLDRDAVRRARTPRPSSFFRRRERRRITTFSSNSRACSIFRH